MKYHKLLYFLMFFRTTDFYRKVSCTDFMELQTNVYFCYLSDISRIIFAHLFYGSLIVPLVHLDVVILYLKRANVVEAHG
jgi:hypothetical protein